VTEQLNQDVQDVIDYISAHHCLYYGNVVSNGGDKIKLGPLAMGLKIGSF